MDAASRAHASHDTEHLDQNHVVGEKVKVAYGHRAEALLSPMLEAQAEDEDVEGQEEDDGSQGEGVDDGSADCGFIAPLCVITK